MSRHKYTKDEIAAWRQVHNIFVYVNPDDSNFLVPKMYGVGLTFNWAHPLSWLIGVGVIALIIYALFVK